MAVAVSGLGVGVAGCGGGEDSDRDQIEATVESLQRAYATNDAELGCASITRRAHMLIGYTAHETPAECTVDMEKVFRWMYGGYGVAANRPKQPDPRLVDVSIDGSRAIATLQAPGRSPVQSPLVKRDGEWKIDGLFTDQASSFQKGSGLYDPSRLEQDVKAAATPLPSKGVRATRADGTPCPDVDLSRAPELSGGCVLRFKGDVGMGLVNPVGTWRFEDPCGVRYPIRVDGQGRTWSRGFNASGSSPCPDVFPCGKSVGGTGVEVPWRGRIERGSDGQLYHHAESACLDTCLGLYQGDLKMRLTETDRGWRMSADQSNLGSSGWQFNDELLAEPSDVELTDEGGDGAP